LWHFLGFLPTVKCSSPVCWGAVALPIVAQRRPRHHIVVYCSCLQLKRRGATEGEGVLSGQAPRQQQWAQVGLCLACTSIVVRRCTVFRHQLHRQNTTQYVLS